MAKLIQTEMETNPWNENAVAWFAYFEGTPTKDDLNSTFTKLYKNGLNDPFNYDYEPEQFKNTVADRAGLERWYICQAV